MNMEVEGGAGGGAVNVWTLLRTWRARGLCVDVEGKDGQEDLAVD